MMKPFLTENRVRGVIYYGKMDDFIDDIKSGKSSPLKNITSNYHYHKVVADSEETLDMIEETLQEKGFLVTVN